MKNRPIPTKILFIADKWCAGNINYGPSEWENNLWKSLKNTGLAHIEVFHFDDYYQRFKKYGDEALIKKIKEYHPDMICLIIYKMPSSDINVPRWETLSKIKYYFKIPILAIWGDLEITEQIKISKALLPYTALNVATASSAAVKRINKPDKYVYMWVPKDPNIFNNPNKQRDIDISYLGSPKNIRLAYINYLKKKNIRIFDGGGEREKRLTTLEYAGLLQRSKMALSFSRASCSHVINARPFEAMSCGALVLEQENFETPKLFIPFIDYVPYTNKKDLLKKVRYYLKFDEMRKIIAKNGYKKVSSLYTAKRFWQPLIDRTLNMSPHQSNSIISLKLSHLSRMSRWGKTKLRFLDTLCSNRFSFIIYRIVLKTTAKEEWKNKLFILLNSIKIYLKNIYPEKSINRFYKL